MNKKRQRGGRAGRGENALTAKPSRKDPGLQRRIERVVAQAKARDAEGKTSCGFDVIRINSSALYFRGTRLG